MASKRLWTIRIFLLIFIISPLLYISPIGRRRVRRKVYTVGIATNGLNESEIDHVVKTVNSAYKGHIKPVVLDTNYDAHPFAVNLITGQISGESISLQLFLLKKRTGSDFTLFLVDRDMTSILSNFVFGVTDPNIGVMSLSTFRLKKNPKYPREKGDISRDQYLKRLENVVIHEIGHAFYLEHVSDRPCIMAFASSLEELDRQIILNKKLVDKTGSYFCPESKEILEKNMEDGIEQKSSIWNLIPFLLIFAPIFPYFNLIGILVIAIFTIILASYRIIKKRGQNLSDHE
ncbi:MAG: hypothetical protein ACE5HY_06415 [Candidatus Hydrothermarchaeales archaeon]